MVPGVYSPISPPPPPVDRMTDACENITPTECRLTPLQTRMHSSRMRTVRNSSRLPGGGVSAPGGCLL